MKQDAGSAVCVYKRKGRPLCCSTEVSGGCRDTIPPSQPRLRPPDLFSAKIPGRGLGGVLVERSIPFLCGEVVLGNYKRSCFKTGIPMNLLKQAISLLAFFFFFLRFLAALSLGIFQISLSSYESRLIFCPKQIL